jgi:CRP-like cAMP-binding protein
MNENLLNLENLNSPRRTAEENFVDDQETKIKIISATKDDEVFSFGEKIPLSMINNMKKVILRKASVGEKYSIASNFSRKSGYLRKSSFYNMNNLANLFSSSSNEEDAENLRLAAIYVLNKQKRSVSENNILAEFLKTLQPLVDMLNKDVSEKNFDDLLKNISFHLKYYFAEKNQVLFKFGDYGDLFYLILRGKVGVFLPKDEKVMMTEEEYLIYLIKLRKYQEIGLLHSCLIKNRNIYRIEEENFDDWVYSVLDDEDVISNLPSINPSKKLQSLNSIRSFVTRKIPNHTNEKVLLKYPKRTNRIKKLLRAYMLELYDIITNNDHKLDIVSPEEYIKRSKPDKITDHAFLSTEKKMVTIWTYNFILSLEDGKKFGDFALEVTGNQKRSATIVALEATHFGTMEKASYLTSIREVAEKVKRLNVNFIISQQIFSNCNRHVFLKSYYNFLVLKKVNWKEKIALEGGNADKIFILKEGEFEISMKKSNLQINDILKDYNGGFESHITEEEREEYWSDGIKFHKLMSEKKFTKLSILKNSEVLGLKDFVMDGKYLFTIECLSTSGEVYEIKNEVFLDLCKIDEDIRNNTKIFEEKKIKHLINRLQTIKNQRIASYRSFKNIKEEEEKVPKFTKLSLIIGSKDPKFDIENINKTLVETNGLSIGQAPEISSYELRTKKDFQINPEFLSKTTNKFMTFSQSNYGDLNGKLANESENVLFNSVSSTQQAKNKFNSLSHFTKNTIKYRSNKLPMFKNKSGDCKNMILKIGGKTALDRSGIKNSLEISHNNLSEDIGEIALVKKNKENRPSVSSDIYEVFTSGKISKLPKFETNLLAGSSIVHSTIMNTVNTIQSNNYHEFHQTVESPQFQTLVKKNKSGEFSIHQSSPLQTFPVNHSYDEGAQILTKPHISEGFSNFLNSAILTQNESNFKEGKEPSLEEFVPGKKPRKNSKNHKSGDYPKKSLHMYEEIGKLSRNMNKIIKKSYSRSLFDKIFHNYLPNKTDSENEKTNLDRLGSKDNCNNLYYSKKVMPNKDQNLLKNHLQITVDNYEKNIENKTSHLKKEGLLSNLKNNKNKSQLNKLNIKTSDQPDLKQDKANIVDCLVMDNFNRLYNTIYYYSDIFTTDKIKVPTNGLLSTNILKIKNSKNGKQKVNYHRSPGNNHFIQQMKNSSLRLKIASMK